MTTTPISALPVSGVLLPVPVSDPVQPSDATAELMSWVRQAASVCRAAAQGDLEPRILNIEATGEMADLLHGINHLLDMIDAFVRESVAALEHASRQKYYRRVLLEGMRGSFRHAAESINRGTADMEAQSEALRRADERRAALADDFRAASEVIEVLGRASNEIGASSQLIKQIASQSNLLALNASIESARAGVAGAGFRIVAAEVKKLAERTASATTDIANKVSAIQAATESVRAAMERIAATVQGDGRQPSAPHVHREGARGAS
ncbi:MAG: methyl-accepting chemotaxis protein [Pirellulaceae bacterium]